MYGQPLLCQLGIHRPGFQFVGSSWHPDLYVRVCTRCGRDLPWRG